MTDFSIAKFNSHLRLIFQSQNLRFSTNFATVIFSTLSFVDIYKSVASAHFVTDFATDFFCQNCFFTFTYRSQKVNLQLILRLIFFSKNWSILLWSIAKSIANLFFCNRKNSVTKSVAISIISSSEHPNAFLNS